MLSQFFQDVRTRVGRDVEVIGESCSESTWARERMLLGRILYKKKKRESNIIGHFIFATAAKFTVDVDQGYWSV